MSIKTAGGNWGGGADGDERVIREGEVIWELIW